MDLNTFLKLCHRRSDIFFFFFPSISLSPSHYLSIYLSLFPFLSLFLLHCLYLVAAHRIIFIQIHGGLSFVTASLCLLSLSCWYKRAMTKVSLRAVTSFVVNAIYLCRDPYIVFLCVQIHVKSENIMC